ncbi:MAG: hypothetical protein ACREL6_10795, partial [Gemmatimonadales bacterium]
ARFLILLHMRRLLILFAFMPIRAAAQDSVVVQVDTVQGVAGPVVQVDTLAVRTISPMGAMWRSMLIPGWGQSKLGRRLTGGIFVAVEGVAIAMSLKTTHELNYLRRTGSGRVGPKKKEQQDWLILLAFNHLMSGLEAYVSAHLWDFPEDLELRAVPNGVGVQLRLPPIR